MNELDKEQGFWSSLHHRAALRGAFADGEHFWFITSSWFFWNFNWNLVLEGIARQAHLIGVCNEKELFLWSSKKG